MTYKKGDRVQLIFDRDNDVERTITGRTLERRGLTYWRVNEVSPRLWPNQPEGISRWVPEDQLELFVSKVMRRKWGQYFVDEEQADATS